MGLRIPIHLLSGDNEWLHFRKHRNLSDPYAPITALYCQGLFSEEAGSPLLDELHQNKTSSSSNYWFFHSIPCDLENMSGPFRIGEDHVTVL